MSVFRSCVEELEKIAAEKRKGLTPAEAAAVGAGTYAGQSLAFGQTAKHVGRRLAESIKPSEVPIKKRNIKQLQQALSDVKAFDPGPFGSWRSSMMIPKGGMLPKVLRPVEEALYQMADVPQKAVEHGFEHGSVTAPLKKSPEFLAHELGHASLRDPKKANILLRALMKTRGLAVPAGLIGGSYLATRDPDSTALKMAPVATAAGYAPLLADEAMASRRGLKALKQMGTYTPAMRSSLMRAFGSYALPAAAATGATGLIALLRSKLGE